MDLLLGLDIGTTAAKALLFDLEGNVVASASCRYNLVVPQDGWVEQDPEELWHGVVETSRSVLRCIGPCDRVVALSLSSQAGTTIPVDAEGRPTHNAISWLDQRTGGISQLVRQRLGVEVFHAITGWPLRGCMPLYHICWLQQNRPDDLAATRRFLFVNDFIIHRLTGQWCMNPSDAGMTRLMNIATADWDERLLGIAGITRDHLSPVHPSGCAVGTLTATASEVTGLPHDLLVVNGAHDQYCAAVGTGVTRSGHVLLSCGTAWVILAVPESLEVGLHSGMGISHHAVEGRWGALRSLGGVGTSLEWFLDNIWGEKGTKNVIDIKNLGGFIGLSLSHSRDDMARAVMEGIAFELRWAMEEMREAEVRVTELKMVGGAAGSPVWPQIVADVTGFPVSLPAVKQSASRGAAILAGVGAGLLHDPETGFLAFRGRETCLEPRAKNRHRYDDLFHTYRQLSQFMVGPLGRVST